MKNLKRVIKFIRHILRTLYYYIEILFTKFQLLFGHHKNKRVIPKGYYCYTLDPNRDLSIDSIPIITCKYYRYMNKELYAGCTYVGFIGCDLLLGDQCKICGVNKE